MIYSFVVSFVAGILFEKIFNFDWSVGVLVLLISTVLSILFFHSEKQLSGATEEKLFPISSKIILIVGIAFCFGIVRADLVQTFPDPNLSRFAGEKISFEAVISKEPDIRDNSVRYIVSVSQNSVEFYPNISEAASKKVFDSFVLLVANRFPELRYGDKIKVSGRLDWPKNFTTEAGAEFDYVSYLSKDKIHFIIYRPKIEKIGSSQGNFLVNILYSTKNEFVENIGSVVPEPNSSLLAGLIFGAKQSLGKELLDDFKKAGLIHIVVLSGYNITVIAVGIFYVTSFLGRRKTSFVISAISIVLFAFMVGLGATVIRASIMALIAILARFLGRPADALRWLFIAGFLMLLWNPLILFYDPSFQLSFMATLGLILFSPFIFTFISKNKISKFVPTKFAIREIVASTLAVQFFLLPLLIKMSGFVSTISFFTNPLVLPLVPWTMALGAITGAIGTLPLVGQIFSWPFGALSYLLTQVIIVITEFSVALPIASISVGAIPTWIILVWYSGYAFLYFRLKKSITERL